jgi:lipoprotein-releasing system ATP-binding protein
MSDANGRANGAPPPAGVGGAPAVEAGGGVLEGGAPVLEAIGLGRTYRQGRHEVPVLRSVSLAVARGERLAIVGASGSGKSTLLHLLGGLDRPDSGTVRLLGRDPATLPEQQLCVLRNQALGFVYQFHHLLDEFTAQENVAMPLLVRRLPGKRAMALAAEMLGLVGLKHRLDHTPAELSGGERQRAAIARALVTRPACVLADEPTGNLDRESAQSVFDLILSLNRELQVSVVLVTHDRELAARMDRVLLLEPGGLRPLDRGLSAARLKDSNSEIAGSELLD